MRTWIVLLILYLCLSENPFVINDEDNSEIKKKATWEVEEPSKSIFKKWTKKQVMMMMGAYEDKPNAQIDLQSTIMIAQMDQAAPASFDGRTSWGSCMAPVKTQGGCGSCWAHATVDSFSTTRCLKEKSSTFVQSSIQYLVSCDKKNYGCNGGTPTNAYKFLTSTGVPTETCVPYTSGKGARGTCPTKCTSSESILTMHKCASGTTVNYGGKYENIKTWVSTNGPMYVAFLVYTDFLYYKSGVYVHVRGSSCGAHAVMLVGWGYDSKSNSNYFICKNSWGTSWGIKGYFYIKEKNCGIANVAFSCLPAN